MKKNDMEIGRWAILSICSFLGLISIYIGWIDRYLVSFNVYERFAHVDQRHDAAVHHSVNNIAVVVDNDKVHFQFPYVLAGYDA